VDSGDVATTLMIARCVQDSEGCTAEEVKEIVRKELKKI
jgi:hypothetical protein